MKKVVGIYCGELSEVKPWDEQTILENGGGGSETWAVEIARNMQLYGYHVIVFGEPNCWKFCSSGVEYVPYQMFEHRCSYQHFDYFISSRQIREIGHFLKCPNVYIMAHDISIHYANSAEDLKLDRVKKIGYLSDYHKWALQDWYKNKETGEILIPDEQMLKVSNGIDMNLYSNWRSYEKENMMVWSSRKERGLSYFLKNVFPLIKESVPDFKVKICQYQDGFDLGELGDGVEFIGRIGKDELSELQKRSKIWIYPNLGYYDDGITLFQETFCITAIENGAAGNVILAGNNGGLKTTLKGYDLLVGDEYNVDGFIYGDNAIHYARVLAGMAVSILTNDNLRKEKAEECVKICSKYTWWNAANKWIEEFNEQ